MTAGRIVRSKTFNHDRAVRLAWKPGAQLAVGDRMAFQGPRGGRLCAPIFRIETREDGTRVAITPGVRPAAFTIDPEQRYDIWVPAWMPRS